MPTARVEYSGQGRAVAHHSPRRDEYREYVLSRNGAYDRRAAVYAGGAREPPYYHGGRDYREEQVKRGVGALQVAAKIPRGSYSRESRSWYVS